MAKHEIYKELALVFLKLGTTAFGGPAAHIAMMRQEVVEKRKWISEQHFLDLIGATNLIPGPNSTELAIHIGQDRAGWKGLLISGFCFIFPAVLITLGFAYLYKEYGSLPEVQLFLYGINPAIISVILAAIFPLARKSLKSKELYLIGTLALILTFLGINEIFVLFGAGFFALALSWLKSNQTRVLLAPLVLLQMPSISLFSASNIKLFLIFLKVGSILYGSGYVLFAFLDAELVSRGLLTRQELVDAIAVGQFTPGPVFSSVTFIGYQLEDWKGALLSTLGIFIPSFVFVALLNPIVKFLRGSKLFSSFLDAVNIASVAIIVFICYQIARESVTDWKTIVITLLCLVLTFKYNKLNSAWIVLLGALLGYFFHWI